MLPYIILAAGILGIAAALSRDAPEILCNHPGPCDCQLCVFSI